MNERALLQVTFGIDLDGHEPSRPADVAGRVVVGPMGMLGLLETRLGLGGLHEGRVLRIMQYLHCLKAVDEGNRFFSRSLGQDELITARALLGWRDQWVEAGWDAQGKSTDSGRISDLAKVEVLARDQLAAGPADRLRAVLTVLETGVQTDLDVTVVDPVEELSWTWQNILRQLKARPQQEMFRPDPHADENTDLGRLQRALRDNHAVKLVGDGTVLYLSAQSRNILADGLVRLLAGEVTAGAPEIFTHELPTSLVAEKDLSSFDRAFQDLDGARAGVSAASRWRPPLQVLPLALSLFWDPLDPHRLLEFLTHPISPLPAFARYRLANTVAEYPGMGGAEWTAVCAELEQKAIDDSGGDPQAAAALREQLSLWIPARRFDPVGGAPLRVLAEQSARVSRWAARRAEVSSLDPEQKSLLFAATAQASQAQQLLDELANAGETSISRLKLERLLDQVTAEGTPLAGLSAELGRLPVCRAPGAVVDACPRVIWWDFEDPVLPAPPPWSNAEIVQLEQHGVILTRHDRQLSGAARRWQRPLLLATRQLILAAPRTSANEEVRHHPLWSTLAALTEETLPVFTVEQLLTQPAALSPGLLASPVHRQALPGLRRWWTIPRPDLLGPRDTESFSSLDTFIKSPYQWVLRYKARLAAGSLARIDTGNRQKGNLLHQLCENLFTTDPVDWRSAGDAALDGWVRENFETLLRLEGANYFLSGQTAAREELMDVAVRAVVRLVHHLRAAGVVTVQMEAPVKDLFASGELTGSIDMLLAKANGEEAVLDLKWGGGKYRRDELVKNKALQLTIYAYMRRQAGKWPARGFFILNESRLLAQDADFFPDAEVCSPSLDVDPGGSLWQEFNKTWQWRRAQLDQGLVELTVTGTEADANSKPPDGALPIDEVNDGFNDFAVLTGWKEGA